MAGSLGLYGDEISCQVGSGRSSHLTLIWSDSGFFLMVKLDWEAPSQARVPSPEAAMATFRK